MVSQSRFCRMGALSRWSLGVGRPMGLDSLNVTLWKRDLNAKGRIYSNETQQPLAGVTVTAFNLTDNTQETFELTDRSDYSVPLRPNKKFKLEFSKPSYVTAELNINTDGMLRGDLLNDIVMEEESIDKVVIYFEFDKNKGKTKEYKTDFHK